MKSAAGRPKTWSLVALLAMLFAALSVLVGCTGKDAVDQGAAGRFKYVTATPKGTVIAEDKRRPSGDANGGLLAGGNYRLSDDRGKVVVVNFWGSWCGPCVIESPQFDTVYREYKSRGVNFVGFDIKDGKGAASDFVNNKDITYPIVFDPSAKGALQLGQIPAAGLPVSVVVDKQGRVAAVYIGQVLPGDLTPVLDSLIAEA